MSCVPISVLWHYRTGFVPSVTACYYTGISLYRPIADLFGDVSKQELSSLIYGFPPN